MLFRLECKAQPLTPLRGLTTLLMGGDEATAEDLLAVCQLTGLRQLIVVSFNDFSLELLMPLKVLKELTTLHVLCRHIDSPDAINLTSEVG
jgi:hypothetical protein